MLRSVTVSTFEQLLAAIADTPNGGAADIALDADIRMPDYAFGIYGGKSVTIRSGASGKRSLYAMGSLLNVYEAGTSVVLEDIVVDGAGAPPGSVGLSASDGSTLTFGQGMVARGFQNAYACVRVLSSHFVMEGNARLSQCTAEVPVLAGGEGATVTLRGQSQIDHVVSSSMAPVVGWNGVSVVMSDSASVHDCEGMYGGGLAMFDDETFDTSGILLQDDASIYNGHSQTVGGAIYAQFANGSSAPIERDGSDKNLVRITGRASVYNNTADQVGGGVYYSSYQSGTAMRVDGQASVRGNTAQNAGGIVVMSGVLRVAGRAQIANNTATDASGGGGGVVLVDDTCYLYLEDTASLTGNRAAGYGGAVLAMGGLDRVTAAAGVVFARNTAAQAFLPSAEDLALCRSRILGSAFSSGFECAYNNYDISYWSESGTAADMHTITVYPCDGTGSYTLMQLDGTVMAAPPAPSLAGYTFEGWYYDRYCTQPFDPSAPVTSDMELYAKMVCDADPDVVIDPVTGEATRGLCPPGTYFVKNAGCVSDTRALPVSASQALNNLIVAVSQAEASVAALLDTEARKVGFALGMDGVTARDILLVNNVVNDTADTVADLADALADTLEAATESGAYRGACPSPNESNDA